MNEPTEKPKTIDDVCGQPKGTFKEFVKGHNEPTELQKAVEHDPLILLSAIGTLENLMDRWSYVLTEDEKSAIPIALIAAKQISTLQALSDLHRDEFIRIRAIATDTEIQGLCDRAVIQIEQHVPLIVQRDSAVRQYLELRAENEEATKKLKHVSRLLDVCAQMGENSTDAEVAASASFKEAIAYTQLEEIEQERDSLTAALKVKDKAICFFASVIKSGESWSMTCEKELQVALSNPHVQKLLKP